MKKIINILNITIFVLISVLFVFMTINIKILNERIDNLEKQQTSVEIKQSDSTENVIYRVSKTNDYYIAFTDNETVDYIYADNTDVYEGSMKRDQFNSMFKNETKNYTENSFNGDLCTLFNALKNDAYSWKEGRL